MILGVGVIKMKWLITSLVLGSINVSVMEAFAASKLGPTPLMLPFFLSGVSLVLACVSVAFAVLQLKRKQNLWFLNLISALIWVGLIALNLKHFNDVLYVT
jgi:hypothetical protein